MRLPLPVCPWASHGVPLGHLEAVGTDELGPQVTYFQHFQPFSAILKDYYRHGNNQILWYPARSSEGSFVQPLQWASRRSELEL